MQQLPVEIQLDFKRMCYSSKLAATDCNLLSQIFECCSKSNLEKLYDKYVIVLNNNSIARTRDALLRYCWMKFARTLNIDCNDWKLILYMNFMNFIYLSDLI